MNIKLANWEKIEPTTCFYVILASFLVVVPCGALDRDLCLQLFSSFLFFLFLQGQGKMEKIFRILLGNILNIPREDQGEREVISHIGPIPIIIPLKLFLDLPRDPVFPRRLSDSQSYAMNFTHVDS